MYESKYFEDVATAAWTYLGKFVPLYLLFIWFFTCKHWWYHIILVPMFMYGYQLINSIYQDAQGSEAEYIDTGDLLFIAPVVIVILSLVYLIRIKIFDRIYDIDLSEIDETNVSVFSNLSRKDEDELSAFQEEVISTSEEKEEDYYQKL